MTYKAWTKEELEMLGRAEYTDKELADLLGRDMVAVRKRRQRLGIHKRGGRPKSGHLEAEE